MATYQTLSMSPFANPMRRPRPQVRPVYNKRPPMMMPGGINLQDLLPNEANPYLGGPQVRPVQFGGVKPSVAGQFSSVPSYGALMDLMNRPQPVRPGPRPMGPPGGGAPFPGNLSPPGGEGFLELNEDQPPIQVFQPPEISGPMPPPPAPPVLQPPEISGPMPPPVGSPGRPDPRPMGPPGLSQPFPVPDANTFDPRVMPPPQFPRPNFGGPQPFGGFGGIGSFLRPYMPPPMPGPYGGGFGGGFRPSPYGGGFGFGGGFGRPNPYGGGFGGGFGRPNPYGGGFGGGGFNPFGGGFGPNINNMTSSFGTGGGFQQRPSGGFGLGPNGTGLGSDGSAYMNAPMGPNGIDMMGAPRTGGNPGTLPPQMAYMGAPQQPDPGAVGQAAPQPQGGGGGGGMF